MDAEKDLVTVTGKMDVKALVENLKKNLKKNVEIVPPKKEKGGEKKENAGGEKDGGGGGGGKVVVVEGNRLQVQMGYPYHQDPYPYAGHQIFYNYPYAPQMFSDENPNACSVM